MLSPRYGETYHSQRGAVSEARHVFLTGAGVADRLRNGLPTTVLEVGFGAGLNTLVTLSAPRSEAPLRIHSLEAELLATDVLRALDHRTLLPRPELADDLYAWLDGLPVDASGRHTTVLARARLELVLGDARRAALPQGVDAVYHDAFSPDVNPELWDEAFLERLFQALTPGGRLVSYTVKGVVRRRLQALGFDVAKVPGPPGGKREVLVAVRPALERA